MTNKDKMNFIKKSYKKQKGQIVSSISALKESLPSLIRARKVACLHQKCLQNLGAARCPICLNNKVPSHMFECGHSIHPNCGKPLTECPYCRNPNSKTIVNRMKKNKKKTIKCMKEILNRQQTSSPPKVPRIAWNNSKNNKQVQIITTEGVFKIPVNNKTTINSLRKNLLNKLNNPQNIKKIRFLHGRKNINIFNPKIHTQIIAQYKRPNKWNAVQNVSSGPNINSKEYGIQYFINHGVNSNTARRLESEVQRQFGIRNIRQTRRNVLNNYQEITVDV